jgi:hypothetical protein
MSKIITLAAAAMGLAAAATATFAQQVDIPGGATGSTVYCLQAGDLNSGAFVGTYLQTGTGAWEERLKAGTFKLAERKRDDLTLELFDSTRSASVQFDFVNKTVKYKAASPNASWTDRYFILNATDRAGSTDCATFAALSAPQGGGSGGSGAGSGPGRQGGGGGGGGGGAGNGHRPTNPTLMIVIPPRTKLDIPPGTQLTAVAGPPCPGHPGHFLCPNKFNCAPIGGVCCPGAGTCNAGMFCDAFIAGNCIRPGDARFCPGTGNVAQGTSLHCAPGQTCIANNQCQ